jgi:hypothetical protein
MSKGLQSRSSDLALGCPTDEAFAGYATALLPTADRLALEGHVLRCADCHELLRAVTDVLGVSRPVAVRAAAIPSVRLIARLLERGVALVDQLQGSLVDLLSPPLQPALGGLRRASASAEPTAAADLLRIKGPGRGLDAIELHMQADGALRLVVSGHLPSDQRVGEILSLLLDHDGESREQRPFDGRPVRFSPIGAGHWRVRLVGRIPGETSRELAQADLELQR